MDIVKLEGRLLGLQSVVPVYLVQLLFALGKCKNRFCDIGN